MNPLNWKGFFLEGVNQMFSMDSRMAQVPEP